MKLDIDSYREIADALVRNKRRSILTGFGIFWGLFMLLFLVGGGKGLKQLLSANFDGFASNAVVLVSQNTSMPYKGMREGRYWQLRNKDIVRLKMMIPEAETVTGQLSIWGQSAVKGTRSSSRATLKGVTPEYAKIEAPQIKYGRYLNDMDLQQERKVCVIGEKIYRELFPEGGDPCSQSIKVGSVYYQIVGVDVSAGNININGSSEYSVSIPMSVAQKLMNKGDVIDLVCLTAKSGIKTSSLEKKIRQVVAREHNFDPQDNQAMYFLSLEQLFNYIDTLFKGVNFLIWLVGLGTLLAGAIGVSNIMMVTVKERTVEIGIRRAIGATSKDVLSQILMEGTALTAISGSFGIVFSVLILNLLETITKHSTAFQIDFSTAVFSLLLLCLLGLLAGLAPAIRAMRIKPVDAMRDE